MAMGDSVHADISVSAGDRETGGGGSGGAKLSDVSCTAMQSEQPCLGRDSLVVWGGTCPCVYAVLLPNSARAIRIPPADLARCTHR